MNCIDHHSNRCHTYKRIEKLTGLPDQPISLQRDPMQTIRDQQASGRVEICNSISGTLISENYIPAVCFGRSRCRGIHGGCQISAGPHVVLFGEEHKVSTYSRAHLSTHLSTLLCTRFIRHSSRVLNHLNFRRNAEVVFWTLDPAPSRDYTEDACKENACIH